MILGTIATVSDSEGVTIVIDGETEATNKKYLWLAPYYPTVGDRVLIEEISGSYVVLGAVVNTPTAIGLATLANRVRQYSNSSQYVEFTYFNGNLWVKINGGSQFALARG